MGILDFFRGKKSAEREVEIESVAFDGVKSWVADKETGLRKDERETLVKIEGMLKEFYVSAGEKLGILEGVDIESKKEHGRAKILVRQGLDKYINSVRVLLKEVGALEKKDLGKFAQEIGKVFVFFEKTSAAFYERATYLVGDEMMAVRNEIRKFYNGLVKMFEGNKMLIESFGRFEKINLKFGEIEKVEYNFKEVGKEIVANEEGVEEGREKVKGLEGEIDKIKDSSEYILNLKMLKAIKGLEVELDDEIGKLKNLIDFKKLASVVHSNERELGVVKNYREHFADEFSRDGGKRIIDLLKSSNMESAEIVAQVDLIAEKNGELVEKRGSVEPDGTVDKLDEVKRVGGEIDRLGIANVKGKRRLEDLGLKLKGLKNEIILLVEKFGVRVV